MTPALRLLSNPRAISPDTRAVLWVVELPEMDPFRALQMGIHGIVRKTLAVAKLIECRREVGAGKLWADVYGLCPLPVFAVRVHEGGFHADREIFLELGALAGMIFLSWGMIPDLAHFSTGKPDAW
jgi:hypothetical protein